MKRKIHVSSKTAEKLIALIASSLRCYFFLFLSTFNDYAIFVAFPPETQCAMFWVARRKSSPFQRAASFFGEWIERRGVGEIPPWKNFVDSRKLRGNCAGGMNILSFFSFPRSISAFGFVTAREGKSPRVFYTRGHLHRVPHFLSSLLSSY